MIRWASASRGTNAIANTAQMMTRALTILIVGPSPGYRSPFAARCATTSSLSVAPDSTRELPGDDDAALGGFEREHRQAPRRRAVDDTRAIDGVEAGRVTRAEERPRRRLPHGDRTALVRADGRIGDDAVGSLGPCLRGQLRWLEPHQGDLIEQGSITDHLGEGVHWKGQLLGATARQVVWSDHLTSTVTVGKHQAVALAGARLPVLLSPQDLRDPGEGQADAEAEGALQHGPSRLPHTVSRIPWKDSPTSFRTFRRVGGFFSRPPTFVKAL